MENYQLEVTGELPLEFEGELIANVDNYNHQGTFNSRWHEIQIYNVANPKGENYLLVYIKLESRWQGEGVFSEFFDFDLGQEDKIKELLEYYDPTTHVAGFPNGKAYEERQAKLLKTLREGWVKMLPQILTEIGCKRPEGRQKKSQDKIALLFEAQLITEAAAKKLDFTAIATSAIRQAIGEA